MDGYISFSQLNDFLFSPFSLYLHECFNFYNKSLYQDVPQVAGTNAHETIDNHKYNKKGWLSNIWLASFTLPIYGKADLYNLETGELVERKRLIKKIYEGQLMQIWAQFYCLREMGYKVKKISIYSLSDNKRYNLDIPKYKDIKKLKNLIKRINNYEPKLKELKINKDKSAISIYASLFPGVK